jgi:hypothetical protein
MVTATDTSGGTATATSAGVTIAAGLTSIKIKLVGTGPDRITGAEIDGSTRVRRPFALLRSADHRAPDSQRDTGPLPHHGARVRRDRSGSA